VFEYELADRRTFNGKDGEVTFLDWCRKMRIDTMQFPFRFKTDRFKKGNTPIYKNVVSWGFYQGSDWRYYIFISYRTSDNKVTEAYHWDVDELGMPIGEPRLHKWCN
jgi:hypothetical protein